MERHTTPRVHAALALAAFCVSLLASGVTHVDAASPYGTRPEDQSEMFEHGVYELPAVFLDAALHAQTEKDVTMDVVVENTTQAVIGALRIMTSVYTKEGRVIHSAVHPEEFAVEAGGTKSLQVTHSLGTLPAGEYRVRAQVLMGNVKLGWNDVAVSHTSGVTPFATVDSAGLKIAQYGKQVFEPMTGPNADANEEVTVAVFTASPVERTLVPVVTLYDRHEANAVIARHEFDARLIGKRDLLQLTFLAPEKAGSYLTRVELLDERGQPASSLAEDRVVVRGEYASVISTQLDTFSSKAGDYNYLTVSYSGAPDAETIVEGFLQVLVRDAEGIAGETTPLPVTLDDRIHSGEVRVELSRDLVSAPTFEVVIQNRDGVELDSYSSSMLLSQSALLALDGQGQLSRSVEWIGVAGFVSAGLLLFILALLVIAGVKMLRRPGGLQRLHKAFSFVTLVVLCAAIIPVEARPNDRLPVRFNTNGINVFQSVNFVDYSHEYDNAHVSSSMPYIQLFINKPVHNSTLPRHQLDNVEISYSFQQGVCGNAIGGAAVYARYDKKGGVCHTTLNPSGAQWQQVHENWIRHFELCTDTDTVYDRFHTDGDFFCIVYRENVFSGTVDLSGLAEDATVTTLQIYAKGDHTAGKDGRQPSNSTTDDFFARRRAHAVNICLNVENPKTDVALEKRVLNTNPISKGGFVPFRFTVRNLTNVRAQNVVVRDAIPAGLTWDQGHSSNLCSQVGNTIECAVGTLNPNETREFDLSFTIPANYQPGICPANVQNIATVQTSTPETTTGNNTATAQASVPCPAACGNGTVDQGEQCDDNNQNNQDACTNQCRFATCGDGIIRTGVEQCDDGNQNNNDGCSAQCQIEVQQADVQIQKNGPSSIQRGGALGYTIIARNNGPAAAQNVTVTDPIPAGVTYNDAGSDSRCNQSGNNVVCQLGTLASGQQTSLSLAFQSSAQTACGTLTNIASISSSTQDTTLGNNQASFQTTVQCPQNGDVSVQKTGPATALRGTNLTYTIAVTNSGPDAATNVQVTDQIPSPLTFVSAAGASCSQNGSAVTCTIGTLAPGATTFIQLTLTSPPVTGSCNQTSVINVATVSSANDPNTGNNQSSAQTTLTCPAQQADLRIVKTGPQSAVYGTNVTYSLTATNLGTSAATNVLIRDAIPSGMSFVSATIPGGSCSLVGNEVRCTLATLAVNQSVTASITLGTSVPTGQCTTATVTNTGIISSTINDPNTGNNQSSASTTLTCPVQNADLSVVKTGPASVVRGTNISYSILVTNNGPGAANGVSITDTIPSGFTFVSATGANCALTGNQTHVGCSLGTMSSGQSTTVTLTFSVPTVQQNCQTTQVTNVVSVVAQTQDPNPGNNTSWVYTTVTCPVQNADVRIVKTGPASVIRGGTVTYNFVVTNAGPATSEGIHIIDLFPAELTYVSANNASCSVSASGQLTCATTGNSVLPAGQSWTFSVTFNVSSVQSCTPSTITNRVTVFSSTDDPNTGNNQSSVQTSLTCPAQNADVSVQKTGPSSVVRGNVLQYTVLVSNAGPATAVGVSFTDIIPSGLTFVSATGANCSQNGNQVGCTFGDMAPGSSVTVTLTFNVPTVQQNCQTTQVTNTVTASSQTTDPNSANNQSSATTSVTCPVTSADLSVQKTGPTTVERGNNVTYTLTVNNSGPAAATNAVITDTVPSGLTFLSASGASCSLNGNQVTCLLGTVNPNSPVTITLNFSSQFTGQCTAGTITNTATLTADTSDPNTANNTSTVHTAVTCPAQNADLSVTKSGPSSVLRGNTLSYTLTVTNNGPATATNVVLTDPFPSGLNFQSASGVSCSQNGSQLTCTIGTLTSGQSVTITMNFTVPTISNCSQTTVTNQATVTSSTTDTNTSNNTSSIVTTTLMCESTTTDISVYKTDNRSTVNAGERTRYNIILTNNSSQTANNLTVTDNVPSGLTILTVSDGGTVAGQQVRWNNISVPGNSSRTLTIDVEVRYDVGNGTILRNTVDVNGRTATDDTTVNAIVYNPPPPPPYFPPPPPPYYPPNPPPIYYPPNPPPVYYPPNPPPILYPKTGTDGAALYADASDRSNVQALKAIAAADGAEGSNGFAGIFYATMIALFAAGSAAASKFLGAI